MLVAASDASRPARIRNTAVGLESLEEETTLSQNVQTCANDPCSTAASGSFSTVRRRLLTDSADTDDEDTEEFDQKTCVDGNLGVYCPCLEATITGQEVMTSLHFTSHGLI